MATLDDAVLEGAETFTVASERVNPLVTDTDTAVGTITDGADSAAVTVENVSAAEGGGLLFTVTLNAAGAGRDDGQRDAERRDGYGRGGSLGDAGRL